MRALFVFLISIPLAVLAQTSAIDSLRKELHSLDLSPRREIDLLSDLAWEYTYIQPDSVKALANRALFRAQSIGDSVREAIAIGTLGLYYDVSGQREQAIQFYLKSYHLQLHNENYVNASAMLNNVGIVYFYSEDFKNALKYFEQAMQLEVDHGGIYDEAGTWVNLGATAKRLGDYKKALLYSRKGMNAYLAQGDTNQYYAFLSNLGSLYLDLDRLDSAEYYTSLPIAYNRAHAQYYPLANALQLLSRIYLRRGEAKQVITLLKESMDLSRQIGNAETELSAWEVLMQAYEQLGEYPKALEASKNFYRLRDTLEGLEVRKQMAALEEQFESERKELQIAQLSQQNAIGALSIQQEKRAKANLLVVVLLISLLCLLILALFIIKRKTNQELTAKNALIETQMHEIDELAKESHHRIKNNLQSVVSILRLQSRSSSTKEGSKQLEAAQQRLESISLLHQSLYDTERFDLMDLHTFIEKLVEQIRASSLSEDLKLEFKLELESIPIQADYALPIALIVNELITNSLKYAFAHREEAIIYIQAKRQENELHLVVGDNGSGFPSNFDLEKQQNFGYRLLQTMIRKMKGSISLSSENGARIEMILKRF